MLTKLCAKCGRVMEFGKPYCDACAAKIDNRGENRTRHKWYDQNVRNQKARAFYASSQWRQLRHRMMRRAGYLCERCKAQGLCVPADEVHHKVPLDVDWSRRLDESNLICLCHACHMMMHGRKGDFDPGGVKKV